MQNGGQHKKIKLNRIYKRCPRNQHLINTSRLLLVQIANYNEFQWTRNFSSLNHSLQLLLQWYATLGGKVKTRKCVAEVFEEKRKHLIAFDCILLLTFIRSTRIHQQTTNFSFILPPLHISSFCDTKTNFLLTILIFYCRYIL